MLNAPTNLLGIVIVLGVLIFVHEAGHFLVAKLFRVRVLVFSLGFGKRLAGFRRGGTDYRLSLIPLGGYVRMAGDTPEEGRSGAPDEFLSKPKWQRFLILVAGPFMNLFIAVAFVSGLNMSGTPTAIVRPKIGEVIPNKPAARAGLKPGDVIVAIDGQPVDNFEDVRLVVSTHAGTPLRVDYVRDGARHTTTLTPVAEQQEFGLVGIVGVYPFTPPIVGVEPGSLAERAGLRDGDHVLTANGKAIAQLTDLSPVFASSKNRPIVMTIERGGLRYNLSIPPSDPDTSRGIGIPMEIRKLPFPDAVQSALKENVKLARVSFMTIGRLLRAEGSVKELSGPIAIARISGAAVRLGFKPMIGLMALISLQLGIMNLLPIPVLDGGHIMILLIEGVVGHDLSLRVKERIQQVGFAALATLMLVVLYNDVITNLVRRG
ncbi:MAG TPA: RIP metalloprotease RseP [Thermoanaerobaculia bacterium]|nr:RIP metalloprotease RseP [Thermoanaerobaculia bacterium]